MNDTLTIAPVATVTLSETTQDLPRVKSNSAEVLLRRIRAVNEGGGCIADKTVRIQHQIGKKERQHSLISLDVSRAFFGADSGGNFVTPTGITELSQVGFRLDLPAGAAQERVIADTKLLLGALCANDYAILKQLINLEA